jgi:hypothetical protein
MFSKLAIFAAATMALVASAAPTPGDAPSSGNCNVGSVQCCNSVQDSKSAGIAALLGLLGIDVQNVTGQVGVTCTPIDVIGLGGNSWYVFCLVMQPRIEYLSCFVATLSLSAVRTTTSVSSLLILFWQF